MMDEYEQREWAERHEIGNDDLKERIELLESALRSLTYEDSEGVIRVGIYGDDEVPEIVYSALGKKRGNGE